MRELAVAIQNENKNVNAIETIHSIKKAGFKNVFVQWSNWVMLQMVISALALVAARVRRSSMEGRNMSSPSKIMK